MREPPVINRLSSGAGLVIQCRRLVMSAEPEQTQTAAGADLSALPRAWQPFTPRGVAAFAAAGLGRLLAMQLLVALGIGAVIAWFVHSAWFPPITQAIRHLPGAGDIVNGRLPWTNTAPVTLAGNRFLTLVVDPDHTGRAGQTSDLQVEFGRTEAHLSGLLGTVVIRYPADHIVAFNRSDLTPWWGAWSQAVISGAVAGTVLYLLLIWAVLAGLYAPVVRMIAAWLRRPVTWGGAWRLGGAALMPGAVLLAGAIFLYNWNLIDLVRLGFVTVFHLVVGWVFLAVSVLCLPRAKQTTPAQGNPFASPERKDRQPRPAAKENPFSDG
jgi:hypothetical protein